VCFWKQKQAQKPRASKDIDTDSTGMVKPQVDKKLPQGASTTLDPNKSPLTEHYYTIPEGKSFPNGLGIKRDIFMNEFKKLFNSISCEYGSNKMKDNTIFSIEWFNLKESETNLFSSKYYFRKSECFFQQLLLALNTLSEQGTALRFIRDDDFNDEELEILIPIIIDISVDGNIDNIPIARDILIKFKENKIVKHKLCSMLDHYLASFDDFIYRRLAELLLYLNFSDLKIKLMNKCLKSNNNDLIELYQDIIEN
jgi:hypothetical protein